MNRLRRLDGCSRLVPVVAEVLEVRSLLSAGAAVHAAAHHAGLVTPATAAQSLPATLHVTLAGSPSDFGGTMLLPPIQPTVGAHAKVHFKSDPIDGVTYTLSLSAKIASVDLSHTPAKILTLSNVKGSLTAALKVPGHHTTSRASLSNAFIRVAGDGSLISVTADCSFSSKHGGIGVDGSIILNPA